MVSIVKRIDDCSVVDLFCGVGGLTHGFVLEGFKVIAGVDCDRSCAYAYEHNNNAEFINKRIEEICPADIASLYPASAIKVLVGCAPCQPFSPYKKKKGAKDEKWRLLYTFADLIDEIQPHIVSMENVTDLKKFNHGKVYNDFVSRLSSQYQVTAYTVFCPEYGIPQNRTRLVLFASKFGSIDILEATHGSEQFKTVRETIGHLSPIAAGQICPKDALHRAASLSELNLRRIRQSKPGGTWKDWDEELVAACHKKEIGKSYDSVYGRMRWDTPAPTITTECNGYGNGRFGHPEQDRAISMREAALLQTFPHGYEFLPPDTKWHIETLARLIGNAVPVDLGKVIARSIKRHLFKAYEQ